MTAPRMTDEAWRDLGDRDLSDGRYAAAEAYSEAWHEGDRARQAESAALARVRRLEEALAELVAEMPGLRAPDGKVLQDICICRSFSLKGACCHTRARATLSEET